MQTTLTKNPHEMKESELRTYFKNQCDQWNLNARLLDIVEDLKAEEIRSDSREYKIFCDEFNKFFKTPKIVAVEVIKDILEADEVI